MNNIFRSKFCLPLMFNSHNFCSKFIVTQSVLRSLCNHACEVVTTNDDLEQHLGFVTQQRSIIFRLTAVKSWLEAFALIA